MTSRLISRDESKQDMLRDRTSNGDVFILIPERRSIAPCTLFGRGVPTRHTL
ncbi:hypothetical protein H6G97_17390 [Nostoc flagelliforme FACHB-838]|uniref:Transposase n=1 Tax=Nostoc flagelliforme FACHB-838 TaxID=2692904 RepID=A0ABR8DPA6_9NOSO|nr:hypothetical protein [Nostoc flagelliforme]MBD2531264.1 hypothetical protein [Nostoc flagelliforme FACHB-838]